MEDRQTTGVYWLKGQYLYKYWIVVLGICLIPMCGASFNLYIGVDEVKTLLGKLIKALHCY